MPDCEYLSKVSSQVRRDIVRMVNGAKSGHPGGSLGCADFLVALFFKVMKHRPKDFTMEGYNQDVFILSNGHISPLFYSVLARSGYFPLEELGTFRKINSRLQGHPSADKGLPGVRIATGSLGQGLSVGIGVAQAKRLNGDDSLVYVLTGDGELQEGQIWEAAMYASGCNVDNLIVTVDYNGKQIDGPVDEVMPLGNLKAKWDAFGWLVLEMNGHNMDEIILTLSLAKEKSGLGQPIVILMQSEMGYGVDYMMGTHAWHGVAPNNDEAMIALEQLEETLGDY